MGFPWWFSGKESACKADTTGDGGSIPGWGLSPGGRHGYPLQYACLENPRDRGSWQATYSPQHYKELDRTEVTQHAHMVDILETQRVYKGKKKSRGANKSANMQRSVLTDTWIEHIVGVVKIIGDFLHSFFTHLLPQSLQYMVGSIVIYSDEDQFLSHW